MDGCHCERCAPLEWARAGLLGTDALPNDDDVMICGDFGRVRNILAAADSDGMKLSGRDAYIARITHAMDDEEPPESDEDEESGEDDAEPEHAGADSGLDGREAWMARLPHLMEESDRLHHERMNYRDGQTYWRRDVGRVAE